MVLITIAMIAFAVTMHIMLFSGIGYSLSAWHLNNHDQPHPTGLAYQVGTFTSGAWDITIVGDGYRDTPASNEASDCVIVFVGDSLTFGHGVHDEDTFANQFARDFGVHVDNVARRGYNAMQVAALIDHYDYADGYIWLHFQNDHHAPIEYDDTPIPRPTRWHVWWQWRLLDFNRHTASNAEPIVDANYDEHVARITAHDNVIAFSMSDNQFIRIPHYWTWVHRHDTHPDALGHRVIYEGMKPHLQAWLPTVCEVTHDIATVAP